ncbi:MAG: hypothetical protein CMP75_02835 [Flavobacteriales bacterium]|nr:hypothetical protein [Flavobacteriales bacterium]
MKQLVKLTFLLFLTIGFVQAQNIANSPYSRFGLGELNTHYTSIYSAMGGVGVGVNNPLSINVNNPASYASFYRQRFVMQTGGVHTTNLMQTSELKQVTNFTNISHFNIGFPVAKWWGSSIGLLPYSDVAYSFSDFDEQANAELHFEGEGGLSRFYIGNAFEPTSFLSIGLNVNYLFGNLTTSRSVIFEDEVALNAKNSRETLLSDFYYDFGLLLHGKIKDWNSSFGLTLNNGDVIDANRYELTERFRINNSIELIEDTVGIPVSVQGEIKLPTSLGIGASMYNENWFLAADYQSQDWNEFLAFGESDSLANSTKIAFGVEYIPNRKAINNYFQMVRYRLGAYTYNTHLQIKNQQLKENVVSFGFGLPMKRSGALLNLSAEFGQRGTTDFGLVKESFARFKVGLVLSDLWFIQRKYD